MKVLYEETQTFHWAFNLLSVVIIIILGLVLVNFHALKIRITEDGVGFGFGIFKKEIPFSEITGFQKESYRFKDYGGWGIRLGPNRTTGYIARSGDGVRIKTARRDYYLSTSNPDRICRVLEERLGFRSGGGNRD